MNVLSIGTNKEVSKHLSAFESLIDSSQLTLKRVGTEVQVGQWTPRLDPLIKPCKLNSIFGETDAGMYLKKTLMPLLKADRFYTSAYPVQGGIGWHTDHDEPGWCMMISYTQGLGAKFYWVDGSTVIEDNDLEGWTVRAGKITSGPDYMWHACLTPVPRWTVILMWDQEADWLTACNIITSSSDHQIQE